jgi:thioredoxin reductase (NADPH)
MADYDTVIIGAGPAGLTAGIYSARYGLKTLIIEKGLIGGTASWAGSIQNYPGYENISGMELMTKFREQAEKAGTKLELEQAEEIKENGKTKEIILSGKTITTKTIIIAVGTKSRWLNVKGEKQYLNKGVHFCATCDGPMYNGKEVAVIGNDSRAAEEAIYLSAMAKKVTLLSPKKELSADAEKQKTLKEKGVEIITGAIVTSFEGKEMLQTINYKDNKEKQAKIEAEGAFIFVGTEPNTEFVEVEKTPEGKIIVDEAMKTSKDGIFACGDCIKKELNQIATCISEGAIAAHTAAKYVQNKNFE